MNKTKGIIVGLFVLSLVAAGAAAAVPTASIKPNSAVTPGALNPAVTQANIKANVCKANWTTTVRPTVTYTNKLKATQLATTYKSFVAIYGAAAANYEEDHLISLQLGGSPTDPKNLWPEPYVGDNAHKKDVVETALKRLICSGGITLADAQKAIATDWITAYNKYTNAADIKGVDSNG
jgi:hypothetical protein